MQYSNYLSENRYNPDHQYYDITISKNEIGTENNFTPLVFSESRDSPIINCARMYQMTICRFTVDTQALPVLIPTVRYNSADSNELAYSFTMTYDDGVNPVTETAPFYVDFVPDNKTVPVPAPPNVQPFNIQDLNSPYYYIYHYNSFIRMLNTTLVNCFNNLAATVAPALNAVNPPVFNWNESERIAELYVRQSHFDERITPALITPKVSIFMNRTLYSLLSTFPLEEYLYNNSNNKNYRFICDSYNNIRSGKFTNTNDLWIKTPQELSTIQNWSPCLSIAFITSLPIQANLLNSPALDINGTSISQFGSYNNQQNILTDFATSEDSFKPFLEYTATGLYRWVDLISDAEIHNISIRVAWRDKTGTYRDLYIRPNTSSQIKILFQKKGII